MTTTTHPSTTSKWDRRETADIWRRGLVYRWSPVFEKFLETDEWVTLKPGQSLRDAENAADGYIGIVDA